MIADAAQQKAYQVGYFQQSPFEVGSADLSVQIEFYAKLNRLNKPLPTVD